ncbi:PstS family phosphate ABC transporter substrate-binding protein [Flavobacterium sp.]|uniref:PstS family phosphate ABC transporter substrate-binding protein n=1 Tax=Flavobacterium sp. TaxID=239 RepID=UPI0039E3DE0E
MLALCVITCNDKQAKQETILKGEMTLLVDETLVPIIEEQIEVFESQYDAKITIEAKSEAEVIQTLANDSARVAILARKLTTQEENAIKARKITPKTTKFATDAIALIANKGVKDTIITLQSVLDVLHGKPQPGIKGLVFDNPNSSTAGFMNALAGIETFPAEGVFSFKTNEETIRYVAENDGMIGVVGLNWLSNPAPKMQPIVDKVNILSVKGKTGDYVFPSQNDIAEGKYPLARDLYIVNCQGYAGLGMGFASFIAGEIGQRIILKSGLVPAKTPSRKILIRKEIEKNKNK